MCFYCCSPKQNLEDKSLLVCRFAKQIEINVQSKNLRMNLCTHILVRPAKGLGKVPCIVFFCILFLVYFKYSVVFIEQVDDLKQNGTVTEVQEPEVQGPEIDLHEIPKWLPQCRDIYMDLGSNIGVQIKKLFEPEKYPIKEKSQERVLQLYSQEFGEPQLRKRRDSGLCALGFEPNPKHYNRLKLLEKKYNDRGWKVYFFPFVVSNKDDSVIFYTEDSSEKEDWGATLFKLRNRPQKTKQTLRAISLSNFIKTHLSNKQIKLVKMDIEGSEFDVLTELMFHDQLCQDTIKFMLIEFHQDILVTLKWHYMYRTYKDLLKAIFSQKCNVTKIMDLDDETYLHDVE